MFRILVVFLLAIAGFQAVAVDADFNGEYRYRVSSESSMAGDLVDNLGQSLSDEIRVKVSGSFRPNESFEGVVGNYLNTSGPPIYFGYGDWMISDEFMLRVGSSTYKIADGSVLGINDYDPVPNLFTGLFLTHSSENIGLDFALVRNPEVNDLFIVSVDARSFPDLVKTANFHFIVKGVKETFELGERQDDREVLSSEAPPVVPPEATAPVGNEIVPVATQEDNKEEKEKEIYLGATLGGGVEGFGYKVTASTDSLTNILGLSNLLLDGKVSYSFDMDNSSLKVYVGGHMDGADYDPLLYERHYNAGKMDKVVWGRGLTYAYGGFSYRTSADWKAGLKGYYFVKSNAGSTPDTKVGEGDMEVDVYVKKHFNSSVSGKVWLGALVPKADADVDVKAQAVIQMKF